jgi:hypothetical protein
MASEGLTANRISHSWRILRNLRLRALCTNFSSSTNKMVRATVLSFIKFISIGPAEIQNEQPGLKLDHPYAGPEAVRPVLYGVSMTGRPPVQVWLDAGGLGNRLHRFRDRVERQFYCLVMSNRLDGAPSEGDRIIC